MAPGAQCPTPGAGGTDMPWQTVPVEYSRASISCDWPACTNQISLSAIPADKPSTLDQAVAKVKVLGDLPSNLDHPRQEERLALLLGALATLQGAKYKAQTLATIVCVCTTWANALSVAGGSLDEVRRRVESDPDWGGFTIMANIAGDVARDIDDGLTKSRKQNLLTIAQYALAWLVELIEKEEA